MNSIIILFMEKKSWRGHKSSYIRWDFFALEQRIAIDLCYQIIFL